MEKFEFESIADPQAYLINLGGLHDAYIERMEWEFGDRSLYMKISDLNVNLRGLPAYAGCEPVMFLFKDAYSLTFNSQFEYEEDRAWIYDIVCERIGTQWKISIINSVGDTLEIFCASLLVAKIINGVTH